MSSAGRDANGGELRGPAALADRLVRGDVRLLSENSEAASSLSFLAALSPLWMLFWEVSTASVDVHFDASEAIVWAQHFAFGYKHPPLTGWLFALWFAVFPRQQWAMNLLTVMTSAVALAVSWRAAFAITSTKIGRCFGLFALMLIPLYDVKAEVLNANTVMIPVWAPRAVILSARAAAGLDQSMPSWPALSQASRCSANIGRSFCSPAWRLPRWRVPARNAFGVRLRPISWPWGRRSFSLRMCGGCDPKRRQRSVRRERRQVDAVRRRIGESANYFVGAVGLRRRPLDFVRLRFARAALLWLIRSGRLKSRRQA